jgi:hypothetical protein
MQPFAKLDTMEAEKVAKNIIYIGWLSLMIQLGFCFLAIHQMLNLDLSVSRNKFLILILAVLILTSLVIIGGYNLLFLWHRKKYPIWFLKRFLGLKA